jgi:hypothetical protein
MAKKAPAADFNLSESIREILTANPKLSISEVTEAVMEKHPKAKLNKGSFTVAFYTARKKLGIASSKRGKRVVLRKSVSAGKTTVNFAMLQSAAKFLSEVGGAEAAIEAIKQVQAVQVK